MSEPQQPVMVTGDSVEVETLRQGFNEGFADYRYNMHMEAAAMRAYLRRSSIAPADCAVLVTKEHGRTRGVGRSSPGGAR